MDEALRLAEQAALDLALHPILAGLMKSVL